ncbi:MAG: hypothetical protein LBG59_03110 [Candidatus Peribacteria bacterium]|jgi:predicted Zn-dependent peptidase|nr:hypothetical protein [Candidatus Peribacteria bacterium]
MRIYIKTPLFNNSKAVPHMVEHCTGHTLSLADFFEHSYGIDGIISAEYTMFEYDDRVSYSDVMEKLLHPLQKKAFLYEKKVLQEEIGNTSYSQGIYEYLVKKIIHPTIALNTAKSLHRDDVLSYHQKRYQPEQMLVVNDDYEILYQ